MASRTPSPSEEQLHYNSLINLFKYTVAILGVLGTVFGLAIGFLTYSDGKEMRDELRLQRKEMKEDVLAMKTELKDTKELLNKQVDDFILEARGSVDQSKADALNEISVVKESSTAIARHEAQKSINNVFDAKNIDEFIVNVAKERMEPQIQALVNKSIAVEKAKQKKGIINDLTSKDPASMTRGLANLKVYPDLQFSESETKAIFESVYGASDNLLKWQLVELFLHRPSAIVSKFYLQELESPYDLSFEQYEYFFINRSEQHHLTSILLNKLNVSGNPSAKYAELVRWASLSKTEAVLLLLNNKEIVKYIYTQSSKAQIKEASDKIKAVLAELVDKSTLSKTYFFTISN